MRGSLKLKLFIGLLAQGILLQCLPAVAEPIQKKATNNFHEFHASHSQGIWLESPIASKVIDQLLIQNWTSLNNKSVIDWSNQISNLALNLASSKISDYATKTIGKYPYVLNAAINFDVRSEGTTNIGGDILFKIKDFGSKEDNSREGLVFLHTKYTGSISNDSTLNAGLGFRHLIGEDLLAGVNGYWDYRTTNYSTAHSRFGLGGELFWKTLSLTNNWYIAGTGTKTINTNNTEYYERVVPGWDFELGYRLPSNPNVAFFARGFRWDYQERNDNTGIQGKITYQVTPHVRVDSWISNEIPANQTQPNGGLDDDVVVGLNFRLTANPVIYKANNIKQMLQQEMVMPVRRRYDVLLERWAKTSSFTNSVGGK
jgi:hypothetical protein